MDGFLIEAVVSNGDRRCHRFSAWGPREASCPQFRFLAALHRLASETLTAWRLAAFDALRPYAGLGETVRDFGGVPRLVRVSEHLRSRGDVDALVERLTRLVNDAPAMLELFDLSGDLAAVQAVLTWAASCPRIRVVLPRRHRQALDVSPLAGRSFADADVALRAPW